MLWSFWCSNEFNGGQCEMKLRRLQQASLLPCTVENDKRQLQAQSQSRSTSKSGISSGAFLVVLQLTMDIMLSPPTHGIKSYLLATSSAKCSTRGHVCQWFHKFFKHLSLKLVGLGNIWPQFYKKRALETFYQLLDLAFNKTTWSRYCRKNFQSL